MYDTPVIMYLPEKYPNEAPIILVNVLPGFQLATGHPQVGDKLTVCVCVLKEDSAHAASVL